jgi:peptidoglycan biosynthesis protein MviN/MurJ (putative lipid II flippase)
MRGNHGIIMRDMMAVATFLLVAKFAAAAKEMAVAWRYGTGAVVDAYLFVFSVVGVPVAVWYSVLCIVLIPLLVRLRASKNDGEAQFRAELLGLTIVSGVAVGLLTWLGLWLLLESVPLGMPPETYALARASVPYLVFLIPLGWIVHYGSVLLMADGRHANSLFEGVQPLALLLILLLWNTGGIWALVWGTLAGTVAQLGMTFGLLRLRAPLKLPAFRFASKAWLDFRSGIGMMLIAQAFLALTAVVDQLFAAKLGTGAISVLGYSSRVLGLFLALGATAIGRATLPIYSRVGHDDPGALPSLAARWGVFMLLAGAAVAALAWLVALPMVELLFERGAFTRRDTMEVSAVLQWGVIQIPFYFGMIAASQALFSARRYRLAVALAFLSLTLKVVLNLLLVPLLGLAGLMVSTAATYAAPFLILLLILTSRRAKTSIEGLSVGPPVP